MIYLAPDSFNSFVWCNSLHYGNLNKDILPSFWYTKLLFDATKFSGAGNLGC